MTVPFHAPSTMVVRAQREPWDLLRVLAREWVRGCNPWWSSVCSPERIVPLDVRDGVSR